MCRQIFDKTVDHPTVTTAAPTGDVGLSIKTNWDYTTAGWRKMLLTVTVTVGASDVRLWGRLARGAGDASDDVWGLFTDQYRTYPLGLVAAALPIGTYHFVIPDVGGLAALYVQNSANTVAAALTPIQEGSSY